MMGVYYSVPTSHKMPSCPKIENEKRFGKRHKVLFFAANFILFFSKPNWPIYLLLDNDEGFFSTVHLRIKELASEYKLCGHNDIQCKHRQTEENETEIMGGREKEILENNSSAL